MEGAVAMTRAADDTGPDMTPKQSRTPFVTAKGIAAMGLALAFLISGTAADCALAQSSAIKIIVNDQAITSMDISGRARLLMAANKLGASEAQKAAQEELIDDTLRLSEAKRRGIVISDSALDGAIAEIAARSKLSPAQFAQALGQAGVPIRTLRERIRVQMAWGRVVRSKVQQNSLNEQNDLIAQMRRQEKSAGDVTAEDYVLQRVVFTLPAKASAAESARRMKEAEALRNRFKGCDQGIELARKLKEVAILNVGRKLASEMPPAFREQVKDIEEGSLTKPEKTDLGIEMYAICDKIPVSGESAVAANMDAEALSAQGKEASDSLTRELRQRANIVIR
jgi:peptidyl-prolyl cis-trans isomerase SurA